MVFNSEFNPGKRSAFGLPQEHSPGSAYQPAILTPEQGQRQALLTQIHTLVNQDVTIIRLYAVPTLNEASGRVHNYAPSGQGPDETWNVTAWWLTNGGRSAAALGCC